MSAALQDELLAFRRDLHAHPELSHEERRTTQRVADRLRAEGLEPRLLPGSGLVCDVGPDGGPVLGLRADMDALPLQDRTGLPWESTVPGVAHACGHDVHTTCVLGAGLLLAREHAAGRLRRRVRLVFQPAEESQPGGAHHVIAHGGLDDVHRIVALHCDPHLDVGRVGLRTGPITSASDHVTVTLHGDGGHTSRPHRTQDLVFALGQVVVGVPAVLGRRLDPRAGSNLTWGTVQAGGAPNVVPATGCAQGTLRVLDTSAWKEAGEVITRAVHEIVAPYGVRAEVDVVHSVPPVVNDADTVLVLRHAVRAAVGEDAEAPTEQSLGGEDFGWYLEEGVPGALARLGTRTPGGRTYDLHQGDLTVDERAVGIGARVLAAVALDDAYRD
ncbi:amidohydrolase [Thalassiella azotivora]